MENPQNDDGGRRESADQLQAALEAVDPENHQIQQQQQQPARRCPRCNSANTKFCYYNNYSQSQPRYFCKGCRRYWTHGGSLRNVPVGGSSRKYKRPRPPPTPPSTSAQLPAPGQMIVPSTQAPPLLPSSLAAPCYFPTSFHSGGGGGGAGFFSSLVALQSINHTPGGTLSSNLGNPLHGFEFGTNLFNKPCVSAGLLPPVTGAAALNTSSTGGGSTLQGAGDISVLKPDQ